MVNWFLTKVQRKFNEKWIIFIICGPETTGLLNMWMNKWVNKSKWTADINVRAKTIKPLGEIIGIKLCGLGFLKYDK